MMGIVRALTGPPYSLAAGLSICLLLLAGPARESLNRSAIISPTGRPL
jgi:hypothetical protein